MAETKKRRRQSRARDALWDAHFDMLAKFVAENGHARVPARYDDDPGLGRFVTRAREAYQAEINRAQGQPPTTACRISEEQIQRLESIGFEWRLATRLGPPRKWAHQFAALARYSAEHGHSRVPYGCPEDPSLGRWVHTQRAAYRGEQMRLQGIPTRCDKRISVERITKLDAVGFEWEPPRSPTVGPGGSVWDRQFAELREFAAEHGNCRVPRRSGHNPSLGRWVQKQRAAYRAEQQRAEGKPPRCPNRITADKIAQLNAIGFEWDRL
jgi:hypothetical protein